MPATTAPAATDGARGPVRAGQAIALVGNEGDSTGPHSPSVALTRLHTCSPQSCIRHARARLTIIHLKVVLLLCAPNACVIGAMIMLAGAERR